MLNLAQVVERPFGISVFGSCIVRVEPDVASLKFAVACLEQQPKDAFRKARETAQAVRAYLAQSAVGDVGFSRLTLSQAVRFQGGGQKLIGYTARVGFHILLHDLDRMEEILSGVVDVGANEVSSVELQTTRLRELRVEARGRAVVAAREKADNYCQAAGVEVGRVIHIEDISPDVLRGASRGHVARELQPDDQGALVAFDPESVAVGAAVIVALEIRK
jgi:uncharacterized protein